MSTPTIAENPVKKSHPRPSKLLADLPAVGFVRLQQVLRVIPLGRTAWLEGVKNGRYPKPVRIGAKAVAWRVEDIRDLITELSRG